MRAAHSWAAGVASVTFAALLACVLARSADDSSGTDDASLQSTSIATRLAALETGLSTQGTGQRAGSLRGVLPPAPPHSRASVSRTIEAVSRTARAGDFESHTVPGDGAAAVLAGDVQTDLAADDLLALASLLDDSTMDLEEAWTTGDGDIVTLARDEEGNLCVVVVQPPAQPCDFDKDGRIDALDLGVFVGAMRSGDPRADIDGNGILDTSDTQLFMRHLQSGG